jgi:hypothetical protein
MKAYGGVMYISTFSRTRHELEVSACNNLGWLFKDDISIDTIESQMIGWFGKYLEGSACGQIEVFYRNISGPRKKSLRWEPTSQTGNDLSICQLNLYLKATLLVDIIKLELQAVHLLNNGFFFIILEPLINMFSHFVLKVYHLDSKQICL